MAPDPSDPSWTEATTPRTPVPRRYRERASTPEAISIPESDGATREPVNRTKQLRLDPIPLHWDPDANTGPLSTSLRGALQIEKNKAKAREEVLKAFAKTLDQQLASFPTGIQAEIARSLTTDLLNTIKRHLIGNPQAVGESPKAQQTYAQVARSGSKEPSPSHTPRTTKRPPEPEAKEDNRLFIRLTPDHPARKHQPFAIKAAIMSKLDFNKDIIRDVQHVNLGIAIVLNGEQATLPI